MMRIITSAILIIGLTILPQKHTENITSYYLEGRIKNESNTLIQGCGGHAWALVVEFEIIKYSDSTYGYNTIPVIFACPLSYKKNFFKKGKKYKLKLSDHKRNEMHWIISNSEALENYDLKHKLWVVEINGKKAKMIQ